MKKTLFLCFMIFVGMEYAANAQPASANPITVSKIKRKHINQMLTNYQAAEIYPSSYLISSQPLNDYFTTNHPVGDVYLHVYFAADANNNNAISLILMPATFNAADGTYVHDPTAQCAAPFVTCLAQPLVFSVNDGYIVDIDNKPPTTAAANIAGCVSNTTTFADAKAKIKNFQDNHINVLNGQASPNGFPYLFTQSFIIYASDLRDFIASNQAPDNGSLSFIQIYVGIDATQPTTDKLTLVLLGLDADGNHIYKSGGITISNSTIVTLSHSVFDESMPCPQCNTVVDGNLDDAPQLTLQKAHELEAKRLKDKK